MPELWERTKLIRSKNAGPFELTFDVIFADDEAFEAACRHPVFSEEGFAELYRVDPAEVRVFRKERIRAIKVSIPRPAIQAFTSASRSRSSSLRLAVMISQSSQASRRTMADPAIPR